MDFDYIEKLDEQALINEITQLFDTLNLLIVVDDIDTLTTQGLDPGMDTLYRLLLRSRAGGKIIYTLRNAPTQSLINAIEVPGLDDESEYPEFIEKCCQQFRQPSPSEKLMRGELAEISERRPLILETIVGLRRTCGSYREAIEQFQYRTGEDARSYLFDFFITFQE